MTAAAARPGVLVYCQHSVGLGHLVRSLAVAGALAERFRVVLASGGPVPDGLAVPPGVEVVQLPPIGSADGSATSLVSLDPAVTAEQAWARRAEILGGLLAGLRPVVVMVELFPFGRRAFAGELLPLLQAARAMVPRPVVVSSVRDILVAGGPDQQRRDDVAAGRLRELFDAVVVHADPRLVTLQETFAPSTPLGTPVHYSGFVVPRTGRPVRRGRPRPQVLVSAGGGRTGGPLLRVAIDAHLEHFRHMGLTTRVVTGPFLPEAERRALQAEAAPWPSLSVERFVPDLCAAMVEASVSISQCGYNTTMDLLRAGVPAVVVPHDAGRETEQAERAGRLHALGVLQVVRSAELDASRLAAEVRTLLHRRPATVALDLDGAAATAEIVAELAGLRRRRVRQTPQSIAPGAAVCTATGVPLAARAG